MGADRDCGNARFTASNRLARLGSDFNVVAVSAWAAVTAESVHAAAPDDDVDLAVGAAVEAVIAGAAVDVVLPEPR